MDNREAVNWLINISADIGKAEHSDLWHYEQALTEIKDMLESAQPDVPDINVGDTISRQAAVELAMNYCPDDDGSVQCDGDIRGLLDELENLPPAYSEQKWIPFKRRPAIEEDNTSFDYVLDGKLPDNGQPILVSINYAGKEFVSSDEFYDDGGCYLYSGFEIYDDAVAWMPLPEPYKEGEEYE